MDLSYENIPTRVFIKILEQEISLLETYKKHDPIFKALAEKILKENLNRTAKNTGQV